MYKEPNCSAVIGGLQFLSVNSIIIERSVKQLGDKAVITLPRNYEKLEGKSILDLMKSGDKVSIKLGYDGDLQDEFSGYLQNIESGVPLVLTVDDEFYPLKRNNWCMSWSNISLANLLKYVAPGYEIECPETSLGPFQISNASTFAVLSALQRDYGFYTYIRGNKLFCSWPYKVTGTGQIHEYTLYSYPVKANNLRYSRAEDKKIRVRVTSDQGAGKKVTYETGAKEGDGSLNITNIPGLTQAEAKTYGDNWYKSLAFDGYSGSITGFGTPATQAGDTIKITDADEDITGSYLIESVRITYDLQKGFERENVISFKV